jgi:hypothetical protein
MVALGLVSRAARRTGAALTAAATSTPARARSAWHNRDAGVGRHRACTPGQRSRACAALSRAGGLAAWTARWSPADAQLAALAGRSLLRALVRHGPGQRGRAATAATALACEGGLRRADLRRDRQPARQRLIDGAGRCRARTARSRSARRNGRSVSSVPARCSLRGHGGACMASSSPARSSGAMRRARAPARSSAARPWSRAATTATPAADIVPRRDAARSRLKRRTGSYAARVNGSWKDF